MSPKFTLLTAGLMTLASLTWLVSAVMVPHPDGADLKRWGVVVIFTVLAGVYWAIYFRNKKNPQPSGTE